jgi:anti-anti-sigma factor
MMELSFTTLDQFLVVNVSGVVDSHAAGRLMDALVEGARSGGSKMIVDLSGVRILTRAGVRGLVVAAKLSLASGAKMRICGASAQVEQVLLSLGYSRLFRCDRSVHASIGAMSSGALRIQPDGTAGAASAERTVPNLVA